MKIVINESDLKKVINRKFFLGLNGRKFENHFYIIFSFEFSGEKF